MLLMRLHDILETFEPSIWSNDHYRINNLKISSPASYCSLQSSSQLYIVNEYFSMGINDTKDS